MHFLQQKDAYRDGRALVFHNIDYLMLTVKLLQKDYTHLASCMVPIGDQIDMSQQEIAAMLRTKTKRFSERDIAQKFKPSKGGASARKWSSKARTMDSVFRMSELRLRETTAMPEDRRV